MYKKLWSLIGGRPWTYIARDTWVRYEIIWILVLVGAGAVLGHYLSIGRFLIDLGIFTIGVIAGHIFWGSKYIPGQKGD